MSLTARRLFQVALLTSIVGLAVYSLVAQWEEIGDTVKQIRPALLAASIALAALSLLSSGMAWRELLNGAGEPVPVTRALPFFLFSQLGKYLPGGIGPAVAQASLADDFSISKTAAAQAYIVFAAQTVTLGVVIASMTLPFARPDLLSEYWWVFIGAGAVLPFLHPQIMRKALQAVASRLRPGIVVPVLNNRAAGASALWTTLTWILLGAHAATIAGTFTEVDLELVLLTLGGYCFAWVAGFVILFLPAGLGARELVLVATLSTSMSVADATLVAVVSRVVVTIADLLVGLGAGARLTIERTRRSPMSGSRPR